MSNLEQVSHLLLVEEPKSRKTFQLERPTYSIGRHSNNDILINSQKVSRHHATLLRRTDVKTNHSSYWILDGDLQGNRSRNGIYVNDKKCLVHELRDGDLIRLSGEVSVQYTVKSHLEDIIEEIDDFILDEDLEDSNDEQTPVNRSNLTTREEKLPEHILNTNILRSNSLTELNPIPIIEIDLYGNIIYLNSIAAKEFPLIQRESKNHPLIIDLVKLFNEKKESSLTRIIHIDNKIFEQNAYFIAENKVIINYLVDKTIEQQLKNKILESELKYKLVVKYCSKGIIIVDLNTLQIIDANYNCYELLEYSFGELIDMNIYDLSLEQEQLSEIFKQIVTEKISINSSSILRNRFGHPLNVNLTIELIENNSIATAGIIIEQNAKNNFLSLPNHKNNLTDTNDFKQHLATAIANAKRTQKLLAVMCLKIEDFANIKHILGYQQGDLLLASLAERLKSSLRSGDTVTHWKDDKFLLLMPHIGGIEEVAKISQRIQQALQQWFKIGNHQFNIQGKIGISIFPQDGDELDILIENADVALNRAKSSQDSNYQFYNSIMNSQASVMLQLEHLLQKALEREEFVLHYQPQINVSSGEIQGVEALLRWQHPELGLVLPDSFLQLAEQTGLIIPIGEWVLRTACQQNKIWQSKGLPALKMAVNISAVQFQQPNLVSKISEILADTGLSANLLELEISATSLMQNIDYASQTLAQLKNAGISVTIDNFAAGFTSLDHLKKLPFDTLKIDRSFVQELTNSAQDLAIISALIALGRGFDLRVVAEGVETKQQIELLRRLKCDQMQGFWFSRPLAAEDATKLLPFSGEQEAVSAVQIDP